MVTLEDLSLRVHEFASRHHILDGHFFTFICLKIVTMFEKIENKVPSAVIM